jgi:hypothetical protein
MDMREYLNKKTPAHLMFMAAVVAGLTQALQRLVAEPYFETVVGFRPFDTQFPLSSVAVAIQLGAYGDGAVSAYAVFVTSEVLSALLVAVFFMLLWQWLFLVSPNRIFALLRNGGILISPFAALICDVVESIGFARLISGVPGFLFESTMEFSILMHKLKFVFQDIRLYFTAFFFVVTVLRWLSKPVDSSH